MRATALLAIAATLVVGAARAEDDPACAKYEEPLAYNACLASHGPKARETGGAPASAPARGAEPDEAAPAAAPRRTAREPTVVHRRGRIHMEFRIR